MSTMNISLPDDLKAFVDEQVAARAYGSASEYLRALIRREKEHEKLRQLLLEGAASPIVGEADARHLEGLRERVRRRAASRGDAPVPARTRRRQPSGA
ncbi:MAG: type II toxin-antitoxin system ParD family antitoxin [Rubrivivax sp.]|nr:type II toxin-antitoxin system ParD family antitoxin [Rubrivivax sp.]